MNCPKCNSNILVVYDDPHCTACGWRTRHQGIDREIARKEVEREARKLRQMQGKKKNHLY
jgi:hypothetical protein